nr:MAG TPA: hypothetical protein [Caudoviricetes sp.]
MIYERPDDFLDHSGVKGMKWGGAKAAYARSKSKDGSSRSTRCSRVHSSKDVLWRGRR